MGDRCNCFENFFADLAGETELFLRNLVLLEGPDADLSDVAAMNFPAGLRLDE